jgi:hypothetical protein
MFPGALTATFQLQSRLALDIFHSQFVSLDQGEELKNAINQRPQTFEQPVSESDALRARGMVSAFDRIRAIDDSAIKALPVDDHRRNRASARASRFPD